MQGCQSYVFMKNPTKTPNNQCSASLQTCKSAKVWNKGFPQVTHAGVVAAISSYLEVTGFFARNSGILILQNYANANHQGTKQCKKKNFSQTNN